MHSFKQFLLKEYLTPKQEAGVSHIKMLPGAAEATDHFFGHGNLTHEEPLENYQHEKSEVHREVERHLGRELNHGEYQSGYTTDKYGRQAKIGRLISDPKLRDKFSADETRSNAKSASGGFTVRVVRGHHVFGQTNPSPDDNHPTGHGWKNASCKNVESGVEREVLSKEAKHGSVVMFVKDKTGKEIYRATLQPHHTAEDADEHLDGGDAPSSAVYSLNSEYGTKHPSFSAHARKLAERLTTPNTLKDAVYSISPHVYDDRVHQAQHPILHPGLSSEDLDAKVRTWSSYPSRMNQEKLKAAASHPTLSAKAAHHIASLADRGTEDDFVDGVHASLARNPNISHDTMRHLFANGGYQARRGVLMNTNLPSDLVEAGIKSTDSSLRQTLAGNHAVHTREHHEALINDPVAFVSATALRSPRTTSKDIDEALRLHKGHGALTLAAANHERTSPTTLSRLITDSSVPQHIHAALVHNPNTPHDSVIRMIKNYSNNKDTWVSSRALYRKDLTPGIFQAYLDHTQKIDHEAVGTILNNSSVVNPTHLHTILSDRQNRFHNETKKDALEHPLITTEHVQTAINNTQDEGVLRKALLHNLAPVESRLSALVHPNPHVARTAMRTLSHEDLEVGLRRHSSPNVRAAIAGHQSTPAHLKQLALHDKDPMVRKAAQT